MVLPIGLLSVQSLKLFLVSVLSHGQRFTKVKQRHVGSRADLDYASTNNWLCNINSVNSDVQHLYTVFIVALSQPRECDSLCVVVVSFPFLDNIMCTSDWGPTQQ